MFSIKSFGKGKGFLFGRTDLFKVMNAVVTQQAAVDGMDVSVSARSVGSVVDYVAWNGDNSVCFHRVKFII